MSEKNIFGRKEELNLLKEVYSSKEVWPFETLFLIFFLSHSVQSVF